MDPQKQIWIDKTFESIENIDKLLKSTDESHRDFTKLANWIYHTKANGWSFMPTGWEGSKGSAQSFDGFLHMLLHAMVDDGDMCFIETEIHGSFIAFADHFKEDSVKYAYRQKMPGYEHRTYEVHQDIDRFIRNVSDYHKQ